MIQRQNCMIFHQKYIIISLFILEYLVFINNSQYVQYYVKCFPISYKLFFRSYFCWLILHSCDSRSFSWRFWALIYWPCATRNDIKILIVRSIAHLCRLWLQNDKTSSCRPFIAKRVNNIRFRCERRVCQTILNSVEIIDQQHCRRRCRACCAFIFIYWRLFRSRLPSPPPPRTLSPSVRWWYIYI